MITVVNGDLLTAKEDLIVHQTNCLGAYNAGIARQVRQKYPKVYELYKARCAACQPKELLGKCQFIKVGNKHIVHLFGQLTYGRTGRHTDYEAVREGLMKLGMVAREHNWSVALPYGIGCGLAGGDWALVEPMIALYLDDIAVTLYKY